MEDSKHTIDDIVVKEPEDSRTQLIHRSKKYLTYLIVILSMFQIYRSYTVDSAKTTALVWYFFPDIDFELGLTYISYMGLIAGLGGLLAIFVQKYADQIGRKPILILISAIMAVMSFIQILTDSIIIFTITLFIISLAANIHVWMLYINEEAPTGKNAIWSTLIIMAGISGPIIFNIHRFFFITNDKDFTILHWKNVLWFSVIVGTIITIILIFTIKETAAYEYKELNTPLLQNGNKINKVSLGSSVKRIFKSNVKNAYIALLILTILSTLGFTAGNVIEPYMMLYSAMSAQEYSIMVLFSFIGMAFVIYFVTGRSADRWGRKPILITFSLAYPVSVILQYVWGSHIPNFPLRFVIMIILKTTAMASRNGIWTLTTLISFELIPTELRGVGNGLQTTVMILVGSIRTLIVAPLFPIFGIQSIALIACFFMFAMIPVIIWLIPETFKLDLKNIEIE